MTYAPCKYSTKSNLVALQCLDFRDNSWLPPRHKATALPGVAGACGNPCANTNVQMNIAPDFIMISCGCVAHVTPLASLPCTCCELVILHGLPCFCITHTWFCLYCSYSFTAALRASTLSIVSLSYSSSSFLPARKISLSCRAASSLVMHTRSLSFNLALF